MFSRLTALILFTALFSPLAYSRSPERIVSLAPSVTELVCFIGEGKRLVGVTRFCDFPESVKSLPKIGGIADVDLEAVIRLKPDLVIASKTGNSKATVERLEMLGIKTLTLSETRITDIASNVILLGNALGIDARSNAAYLDARLRQLPATERSRKAMALISIGPFYSASTNTFIGNALELAGFENIVRSSVAYPVISLEEMARLRPDTIIAADVLRPEEKAIKSLLQRAGVSPRMIWVNADRLSRPSPRIFDLLDELILENRKR